MDWAYSTAFPVVVVRLHSYWHESQSEYAFTVAITHTRTHIDVNEACMLGCSQMENLWEWLQQQDIYRPDVLPIHQSTSYQSSTLTTISFIYQVANKSTTYLFYLSVRHILTCKHDTQTHTTFGSVISMSVSHSINDALQLADITTMRISK